jgi:hypothetical protein
MYTQCTSVTSDHLCLPPMATTKRAPIIPLPSDWNRSAQHSRGIARVIITIRCFPQSPGFDVLRPMFAEPEGFENPWERVIGRGFLTSRCHLSFTFHRYIRERALVSSRGLPYERDHTCRQNIRSIRFCWRNGRLPPDLSCSHSTPSH